MNIKLLVLAAMLSLTLTACEKAYPIDDDKQNNVEDAGGEDTDNNPTDSGKAMTIAEAQDAEPDSYITVRGYIVGSCTRSMKNTDFTEPFVGSTAIILAPTPITSEEELPSYKNSDLFPICLSNKTVRAKLNLEDNPELWNEPIIISGKRTKYMTRPGINPIKSYKLE